MYVLVAGNVIEGFKFYGPFSSVQSASDYAEGFDVDTTVVEVEKEKP